MKTLTLKEAAERLGISRQAVHKAATKAGMLKRRENPYVRGGFHWVISERDVEKLRKGNNMAPGGYNNDDGNHSYPGAIVRYFHREDEPTGDLGYCQTADGTVWHIVHHLPLTRGTGDRHGHITGGRVRE